MFKRILSIFVSMALVSTSYAQTDSVNEQIKKLPNVIAEFSNQMNQIENRGYELQNDSGIKISFRDLPKMRSSVINGFHVLAPPVLNEEGVKAYQLKVSFRINRKENLIGVKLVDSLDAGVVLGRTTLKLPTDEKSALENQLAIKSLSVQAERLLREQNKIVRNESKNQNSFAKIFLSVLFPKAHAGIKNVGIGLVAGLGGVLMMGLGAVVLLNIMAIGMSFVENEKIDFKELGSNSFTTFKLFIVLGSIAGFILMCRGFFAEDGKNFM